MLEPCYIWGVDVLNPGLRFATRIAMAKSEEGFDPYYKWLGIKPKDQPPNHYRLLGVELFESDLDVIANTADMQMAHLRKFQSGKHSQESQSLLNEVARAKVCLLNREKKAEYDEQLREELRPPKVEPPAEEPTFAEPEPVGFPFVDTGQVEPVDEVPFFGPPPDVGSPDAGAPAIGPPPGFVEPMPINPFAEPEVEEPLPPVTPPADAIPPSSAPTFRPPTAKPPGRRPAPPPVEPAPPGEKPSLDEALSKVMSSPAGAPAPPVPEVTAPQATTPPVPEVTAPQATTPATTLAPDELAKKIAADLKAARPPFVERAAPSWISGRGELIGFAVLAGLAVAAFLVPRFIPVWVENSKWMLFGYWFLALLGSIAAVLSAAWHFGWTKGSGKGSPEMLDITRQVRSGVRAFLWQHWKSAGRYFALLLVFIVILAYFMKAKHSDWLFGPYLQRRWIILGLFTSVFSSALAGRFGMRAAIWASIRMTAGTKDSAGRGMQTMLKFGAVSGLLTAGFCLLEVAVWFGVLYWLVPLRFQEILPVMLCFGIGAASYALLARIGGGIFANAGEAGSEFAEEGGGVPKNHKRNPGAVAQSAGNIVGMGADLHALFYVGVVATALLGTTALSSHGGELLPKRMGYIETQNAGTDRERQALRFRPEVVRQMQLRACLLTLAVAGAGVLASVPGVWAVRAAEKGSPKRLLREFDRGINWSVFLTILAAWLLTRLLMPDFMGLFLSIAVGVLAGWVIGRWGERAAGSRSKLAWGVAERAAVGPATMSLGGMANAMRAVFFPVIVVAVTAFLAFGTAVHWRFDQQHWWPLLGLYGIGLASVGMLSTLGMTLAGDACGSIADNTLRHSMMAKSKPGLQEKMAVFNAIGGAMAMRGKLLCVASTALVGLVLLAVYLARYACFDRTFRYQGIDSARLTIQEPRVMVGIIIGVMVTFVFSALIFRAVESVSHSIARAIREQFRENPGMLQATKAPDYRPFIAKRTKTLYRLMRRPLLLAFLVPLAVGIVLGPTGVAGLLFGATVCGLCMGMFLACAGQSWTLAKEHVQKIADEQDLPIDPSKEIATGTPAHEMTSRSLAVFLILMGMFSLLIVGLVVRYNLPATKFF